MEPNVSNLNDGQMPKIAAVVGVAVTIDNWANCAMAGMPLIEVSHSKEPSKKYDITLKWKTKDDSFMLTAPEVNEAFKAYKNNKSCSDKIMKEVRACMINIEKG